MSNGRVHVYVDGFNLYYGLKSTGSRSLYWLDVRTFMGNFLAKRGYNSLTINYYTAVPLENTGKIDRHETYCKALASTGVNVVYGRYQGKSITCRNCGGVIKSYEEKETDVNIALGLVKSAASKSADTVILFSGDSDFAPAVDAAIAFGVKVLVLFPLNRNQSNRLKRTGAICMSTFENLYKRSQFLDRVYLSGDTYVDRPTRWK